SIEDYLQNKIKKHEETRPSRTRFMIELFKTTKVLGDPTLLSFKSEKILPLEGAEILYDFYSVDGKRHEIGRISKHEQIEEIRNILQKLSAFYIADGNHRTAAMAEFSEKYPQLDNHSMLSLLMPEEEFEISSFHRLIKSVEAISPEVLLEKLRQHFVVS